MIYFLLSAILAAQILIIIVLFIILNHLEAITDFSKEDAEIKDGIKRGQAEIDKILKRKK